MATYQFLYNEHPKVPVFYILAKVHNPGFLPQGRPIVAAKNSLCEPLSQFVDFYLKPSVGKMSTYIEDTGHFINLIEGQKLPGDAVLVTLDRRALYTNIPLDEARYVVEMSLESRPRKLPPTYFLLELVDIILEKNFFRFDNELFLQVRGVSMGHRSGQGRINGPFAPSVANLFVYNLEETFILNAAINPFFNQILWYKRFMDDVFLIFSKEEKLETFITCVNAIHPTIKFSHQVSKNVIAFLDTALHRNGDSLAVRVF